MLQRSRQATLVVADRRAAGPGPMARAGVIGNQARLRRLAATPSKTEQRVAATDDPVLGDVGPSTAEPAQVPPKPAAPPASPSAPPAAPPPATPSAPQGKGKVTAITAITSAAGALSGFPVLVPDLNTPGPFNDTTTGVCKNVQQIKFDLAGITPNEVDLTRLKNGVAGPVGKEQARTGNDGPSNPTKLRGASFIAVADSPGISLAANATKIDNAAFPLRYTVGFELYAFDIVSKAILAKVTYTVNILKQSVSDPNPVNEFKSYTATAY